MTTIKPGRRAIGQHSAASPDWGSPDHIVAIGHAVQGLPDVDPASSPKWNAIVRARRIITARQDGTRTPWAPGAPPPHELDRQRASMRGDTAHINPPGDRKGELVAAFWRATAAYYSLGWLRSAFWVGFSVEQLARLQRVGAASDPLEHVTLIPCRRLAYSKRPGVPGEQPGHASYVTLLPESYEQVRRFVELCRWIGRVVVGDRWRGPGVERRGALAPDPDQLGLFDALATNGGTP